MEKHGAQSHNQSNVPRRSLLKEIISQMASMTVKGKGRVNQKQEKSSISGEVPTMQELKISLAQDKETQEQEVLHQENNDVYETENHLKNQSNSDGNHKCEEDDRRKTNQSKKKWKRLQNNHGLMNGSSKEKETVHCKRKMCDEYADMETDSPKRQHLDDSSSTAGPAQQAYRQP